MRYWTARNVIRYLVCSLLILEIDKNVIWKLYRKEKLLKLK